MKTENGNRRLFEIKFNWCKRKTLTQMTIKRANGIKKNFILL